MRQLRSWSTALLLGVLAASPAAAQQRETVSGHITDSTSGQPLANARVNVIGTSLTAIANASGNYTIAGVSAGAHVVRVTALGFVPQQRDVTVAAGQPATLDFRMVPGATQLSAVVSIGYGTARREELTGAVASVNVADVPVPVTANVGQMLEGHVAGAQVTQDNGAPGGGLSIRVRGTNSIAANSEPLYVIDGVPAITGTSSQDPYQNPLSALDPNDIQSIEILKDASSTAIYGARGAAGVVLITTKRGNRGENHVTMDVAYGTQAPSRIIPMLNATQFATLVDDARANAGLSLPYTQAQISAMGAGTDWQRAVLHDAPQQSYNVGVTGGDDRTRYLISGSYFDQGGVVIGSAFDRYAGRVNLDRSVTSRLRAGTNLSVTQTNNQIQPSDNTLGSSTVMGALWFNPVSPIRNADGSFVMNSPVTWPVANPVANAVGLYQERSMFNTIGNLYGEYTLLEGLRLRSSLGITTGFERYRYYAPRTIPAGVTSNGSATDYAGQSYNIINENTVNYTHQLLGNALDLLGGFTAQKSASENVSASNSQFSNDILGVYGLGSGTLPSASTGYTDWALLSWLGRANYNVADKYLFTLTARRDGSSRFGRNNKWGTFPSAAFAWRAIDESFMRHQSLFSDLKLRLSYGVTGNQEIGLYNSLARLAGSNYAWGGTTVIGYATSSAAPNPDLKWETTKQSNVGLDLGFLNNRVTSSIDAYHSITSDLLLSVPLPASTGYSSQLRNVGSVRNDGVELALTTFNVARSDFSWRSTFTAAANRNKVLNLGGAKMIPYTNDKGISGQTGGAVMVVQVGQPLGSFYGLRTNGLYQQGDPCPLSKKRATLDCVPGEYRYVDTNGDSVINSSDRVILGNAQPKWYGGFTNDFTFGPLSANLLFQGSFGNKVLNGAAINIRNVNTFSNQTTDALDRWTPTHTNTGVPRANANRPRELYDIHVEDGSYVRLQNLTFAYQVPARLLRGVSSARVFVTGQNLHVWTTYTGYDPEVNSFGGDASARGIDLGAYPRARVWSVGANLSY